LEKEIWRAGFRNIIKVRKTPEQWQHVTTELGGDMYRAYDRTWR